MGLVGVTTIYSEYWFVASFIWFIWFRMVLKCSVKYLLLLGFQLFFSFMKKGFVMELVVNICNHLCIGKLMWWVCTNEFEIIIWTFSIRIFPSRSLKVHGLTLRLTEKNSLIFDINILLRYISLFHYMEMH